MNRKIGVVLLALVAVLCLSFAACNIGTGTAMTKEEALQNYIFENDGQIVKEDFVLPKRLGDYRATWTSDSEYVVLEKGEDSYIAKVTIPEEDAVANLTVDLRGVTKSYTVRLAAITTYDIMESFNFPQNRATVYEDFELLTEATYKGKTATITWAVEDEASKANISVDGNVCKVLPSSLNPTVKINATFTYKDKAVTTFYTFTVSEKMEHLQEVNYWYTNTGVSINMKGYVVAIGTVWSSTYNNVTLYMMDENFDAGYYLYRVGCDAANAANLKPGAYVTVEGTTNTLYNGLYETNAGGTLKVDTTKEPIDVSQYVYAIDNDILSGAPAANYNQSRLVSLTNWKVESVKDVPEAGSNATLFTLEKGGKKVAVSVSKYFEGIYTANASDPAYKGLIDKQAEIKQKVDAGEEVIVSVKGILGNYNGAQIMPYSAADVVIGGTIGENDTVIGTTVGKAIAAVNAQFNGLPSIITTNTTLDLAETIEGVAVSYRLLGVRNAFGIADGKLAIVPATAEVATLQATFTYEGYTANTFYVMRAENLDDQGKAEWEIENLEVMTEVVASGEYELPTTQFFDNAQITWTSGTPYAAVNGNKVTVSLPLEAAKMVLTATVTVGEGVATRDYYVAVSAMNTTAPVYAESAQEGEFKLALDQNNLGKTLYLNGEMDGYYFATTTNPEEAAAVTVKAVDNGYTMKTNGKYIEIIASGTHINVVFVDQSSATWSWNDEAKVYTFDVDGTAYYLGTSKTYNTMSASKISYITGNNLGTIGVSNFPAKFVTGIKTMTAQDILDGIVKSMATTVAEDFALDSKATWEVLEGSQGIELDGYTVKVTQAEAAQTATLKATLTYNEETVTAEVTITIAAIPPQNPAPMDGSYVLGMYQKSLDKWLYAKAENSSNGRYLVTTENPAEAAEAVLTTVEGGYTIQLDGKFVELANNAENKTCVVLLDAPTSVWTWNEEAGVMTFTLGGKIWYLGTYGTYNTVSASETWRITGENLGAIGTSQFICEFVRHAPADGSYIYGLYQKTLGKTLYAKAENSSNGRYLVTTENPAEAAEAVLTTVEGGYTIKLGGKFVELANNAENKTCVVLLDASTSVWTWNEEAGVLTFTLGGKIWYLGTYGTYNTVSASETWRITGEKAGDLGTSQFVCKFEVAPQGTTCEHAWNDGEITTEATCTQEGVKTFTCTLCGETKTEPIAKLDHVDANNDNVCDVCGADMGTTEVTYTEIGTVSFADKANRATFTTEQQVWNGTNGVQFINDKADSVNNVADYAPVRCYPNSKITIKATGIRKIVFVCNDGKPITGLTNALAEGTYTVDGLTVTVILPEVTNEFSVQVTAQVRIESITVYSAEGGSTIPDVCEHVDANNDGLCDNCGESMGTTPTPDVPTDPVEILNEAYALAKGASLAYQPTLTGIITRIDEAYSEKYGNITVTIVVANVTDKPLKCYHLKGGQELAVNDTITVTGTVKNYNGTIEYDSGCTYKDRVAGTSTIGVGASSSANANVKIKDDQTQGENGTKFTFTVIVADGYELVTVKVNGVEVVATNGVYEGTIAGNTTIVVETKQQGAPDPIVAATFDFTAQGYTNAQAVTELTVGNYKVTFTKGTNRNAPKYYTSGTAIRCYGGNTFTISGTSSGTSIVKIEITFGSSDGTNEITCDSGEYVADTGTWTGSADSVTFTVGGTTGNRRIAKIVVYILG